VNPLEHIRARADNLDIAIALVVIVIVGSAALAYLIRRGGFVFVDRGAPRRWLGRAALAATVLVAPTLIVDSIAPFPEGINVPLPESALFYPIIGVVAEVAFHLLPLAVLVAIVRLASGAPSRRQLLGCFAVVACAEPAFQVLAAAEYGAPWVLVYLSVQLFALSMVQLELFRRHGFVAMYAVRFVYYLYWHLAWGTLRLDLLF
jgi:hypothetical protein